MKLILTALLIFFGLPLFGQQYKLDGGKVTFFSSAPVEDIEATTTKVISLFDIGSGEIAFVIPISSFQFRKKLMQEHFNENYMESHKYPDATFKGKISGFNPELRKPQTVLAKGILSIHGESREMEVEGIIDPKPGVLRMDVKFPVKVADYNIEIPQLLFYNVAEVVEVTLNGKYVLYEKK